MGTRRPPGTQPPDDAYSRVTEPERYQPVADAAERVVAELVATYDVDAHDVARVDGVRVVRLVPSAGSPLEVQVTPFPGARLHFGVMPEDVRLPDCGCDACDDDPDILVELLLEAVDAVVGGDLVERLGPDQLEVQYGTVHLWHQLSVERRLRLVEAGVPVERTWPAWPVRAARRDDPT